MPHGDAVDLRETLEAGAGAGRLLYVDASVSGVAGDMFVAAMLDLGVPLAVLQHAIDALSIGTIRLEHGATERSGIRASRFVVPADDSAEDRSWAQIRELLEHAPLGEGARERALATFEKLAHAEAEVHGVTVDSVVFHEVGAVDSIVDIVAASVALEHLGASVVCSPLPLGSGIVQARHGPLPLPAPATVACLRGAPTFDGGASVELVTPTGAAIVASAAERFERWPAMKPDRTGWGAGSRTLPDRPNLVRVVLGERELARETLVVLEANVDDMSPEIAGHVVERLMAEGALDAWLTPIVMKKGRPAVLVSALAEPPRADGLAKVLASESTTLGVRRASVERSARPRRTIQVDTVHGTIAMKVADGDGLPRNVAPEHEDCRRAAIEHGVPLKEVYALALAAAIEALR
ncbi:MAG: nickel pincer cofactor biosynthesis protein LarC [Deltaproteobacteria bacterium]|nr:nickel pincer cofactor biosynthesis protein LarC [Deltaproteobacteria bacterium]